MDQDEAALLAELRAISNKTSASSRFDDDDNNDDSATAGNSYQQQQQRPPPTITAASAAERLVVAAGNLHDALQAHHSPRSQPTQMLPQQQQQRQRSMSGSTHSNRNNSSNNNNTPPASPSLSVSSKHSAASAPTLSSSSRGGGRTFMSGAPWRLSKKKNDEEQEIPTPSLLDDLDDDDNLSSAATKEPPPQPQPPKRTSSWPLPPWKRGSSSSKSKNNKDQQNDDNNDNDNIGNDHDVDRVSVARSGGDNMQNSSSNNNNDNDDRIVEARKAYGDVQQEEEVAAYFNAPPSPRLLKQQQQCKNQAMSSSLVDLLPPPPQPPHGLVLITTLKIQQTNNNESESSLLSMVSNSNSTNKTGVCDNADYNNEQHQQQQNNPLIPSSFSPTKSRNTDRLFAQNITIPTVVAASSPPASPRHVTAAAAAAAQKAKVSSSSSSPVVRAIGGGGNFKSNNSSKNNTFTGERGGAAEDAELLALLRGVSNKSGAASRFADNDDDNDHDNNAVNENQKGTTSSSSSFSSEPVQRKNNITVAAAQESSPALSSSPSKSQRENGELANHNNNGSIDNIVAAPSPTSRSVAAFSEKAAAVAAIDGGAGGYGIRSVISSKFSGERGGAAEDAELLALLRGVSNKSGAADRFADDNNDHDGNAVNENQVAAPAQASALPSKSKRPGTPPWKKRGPKQKQPANNGVADAGIDIVVAAPAPPPRSVVAVTSDKAAVAAVVEGAAAYGIKSEMPASKFSGERGGAAEDAELLALLRGVSNKSGAADRFADDNDRDDDAANENQKGSSSSEPKIATTVSPPSKFKRWETLPWKKRGPPKQQQPAARNGTAGNGIDIVVAAPAPPPRSVAASEDTAHVAQRQPTVAAAEGAGYGMKSDIPSTFSGERGGAAEDAELLALLRGVSSKSGAADRFADDNNDDAVNENQGGSVESRQAKTVVPVAAAAAPKPAQASPSKSQRSGTPPWKKRGPKQQQSSTTGPFGDEIDIVVAAPPLRSNPASGAPAVYQTVVGAGFKSERPSTFKGERGGAAEDPELLALLRGVSSKSGAVDRFGNDDDNTQNQPVHSNEVVAAQAPVPSPSSKSKRTATPPWKRKGPKQPVCNKHENEIDVVVAAPRQLAEESTGYGIKSDIPSTFAGERGGAAEDAELLALLRGVSSGADRFAENQQESEEITTTQHLDPPALRASKKLAPSHPDPPALRASKKLAAKPWKQRGDVPDQTGEVVDVVVAAPRRGPKAESIGSSGFGIKSDIPSTFSGERGGTAEDAELLALLRGVSNKSGGADRFASDEDIAACANESALARGNDPPALRASKKFGATPKRQAETGSLPVSVESAGYGIKSDIPSAFKGERGGEAEDAELLALLRGVSNKSGGGSRFSEEIGNETEVHQETARSVGTPKKQTSAFGEKSTSAPSPPSEQPDVSEEERITIEDLPEALNSKDWKMRAQAFVLLKSILTEQTQRKEPTGDVDADSILQGLDDMVRTMPDESNAMALDKALDFLISYAAHCRRAGDAEQAAAIISSVVAKNALSSRPSTLNLSTTLALKLMEVGADGNASVNAVVDVLLSKGLASRKPKVVHASASIILAATKEFGAVNLPLASVVSSSPKMFSHVNAQVRTIGLEILAEFCRVLGSKAPLQEAIDSMKKAQVTELDTMLAKQPDAAPSRRKLRSQLMGDSSSSSPEDALAALQAGAKEREAQRFASRPAVKLMEVLPRTEYSSKICLHKWSDQVAALKIVLDAGGEKPYKLEQPSSAANYGPLISEMKKLLSHTHFAVCSKAMEVLSMLAEGVGEKLFPHLRPILPTLLALSKDKKLTKGVGSCLDSFFGNVVSFDHLLDPEDALPISLEERKEKNALARASALEFLERCVRRRETAGRRGVLSPAATSAIADLCTTKLDDSDASVRKAVTGVFQALQAVDDEECSNIVSVKIEALKASHARVFKTLTNATADQGNAKKSPLNVKTSLPPKAASPAKDVRLSQPAPKRSPPAAVNSRDVPMANRLDQIHSSNFYTPILEEALSHVGALRIPQWDAPEDDGGVVAGLHSSTWIKRQDAIKSITAFVESGQLGGGTKDVCTNSSSILVVVREHTRGFTETNVNIMKSILLLFVALCDYHESAECEFMDWGMASATAIAVQKLSDRKLSDSCKTLLSSLCATCRPGNVLLEGSKVLKPLKSPVIHEEYLKWFKGFCGEFGAVSIGSSVSDIIPWILNETVSTNPKVKLEALSAAGVLHRQLGPGFKALTLSMVQDTASREQLEKCFNSNPFDPSLESNNWPRQSIAVSATGSKENDNPGGGLALEVPKLDLMAQLPDDCVSRMGSKDGKTAWKQRKSAIDEVDEKLKVCNGLVDTSPPKFKPLVDLMRGLRDRLGDTQINLKPMAARVIGVFLGHVDKPSQARLGKIVFGPLINAAMNDIKKQMREASIEALRQGTTSSSLDGGGPNQESLEVFLTSFVGEVNETAVRSGGLADVLSFVLTMVDYLPNLDEIVASRGQSLGENYAAVLVACLTSSKSETRAAATTLLEMSINKNVVNRDSVRKTTEKLKPASQRAVGAIIAKFSQNLAPNTIDLSDDQDRPIVPPGDGSRLPSRTSSSSSIPGARSSVRNRPAAGRPNDAATITTNQPPPPHRVGDNVAPSSKHPLVSGNRRIPSKPIVWPEFPEEPTSPIFGTLKNLWAPILPGPSVAILFPKTGIRKQDDAKDGCELLSAAIDADRLCPDSEVERQLDCIVKWIVYVLCCREATVGLQALITLIKKLFLFLCEIRRPLTDSDAMMLAPFILEKASNAKGRFGESLMELVSLMQSEELMPAKRLGAVACVSVIERSNHAKSRALACHICVDCIHRAGLVSVGKKGVLVAAKALSTEHIPENKAAALDLMEAVLEKMQGDVPKLVKVCGPHLSNKARQDLEDRWRKNEGKQEGVSCSTPRTNTAPGLHSDPSTPASQRQGILRDELPALSLRETSMEQGKPFLKQRIVELDTNTEDPFTFAPAALKAISPNSTSSNDRTESSNEGSWKAEADGLATAASLRARLLRIRGQASADGESIGSRSLQQTSSTLASYPKEYFDKGIATLGRLTSKETRVSENDDDILASIDVFKTFHAALSQEPSQGADDLRHAIKSNLSITIENITNCIGFAFNCVDSTTNADISVPLLSVGLATLMALVRDGDFETNISQDDLVLLLQKITTALLDSRLSGNSGTSLQLVKAMNKAAVQSTTNAARHTSLQALLTIQQQLSLEVPMDSDHELFNSRQGRVLRKLFLKVVEKEEKTVCPFSTTQVDMESLLCCMEDVLAALRGNGHAIDSDDDCSDLIRCLVRSIIKSYEGTEVLRHQIDDLGIDPMSSCLGELISFCMDQKPEAEASNAPREASPSTLTVTSEAILVPSVASLVSALVRSKEGPERQAALEALREYKKKHGDTELNAHLQENVSSAFRDFIEGQLHGGEPSPEKMSYDSSASNVSERLRILRSRLQGTVQTVPSHEEEEQQQQHVPDDDAKPPSPGADNPLVSSPSKRASGIPSPTARGSRLARPSPSRLPQPKRTSLSGGSLPQRSPPRLAAQPSAPSTTTANAAVSTSTTTTLQTGLPGRAAQLRARLEAMKEQNKAR